jgi:hypothetical protein
LIFLGLGLGLGLGLQAYLTWSSFTRAIALFGGVQTTSDRFVKRLLKVIVSEPEIDFVTVNQARDHRLPIQWSKVLLLFASEGQAGLKRVRDIANGESVGLSALETC